MTPDRKPYATDGTDAEWAIVQPLVDVPQQGRGRKRIVNLREIVNALRSVVRTGVQWELLPHDFPPSGTVVYSHRTWTRDGTWQQITTTLGQAARVHAGRAPEPTGAVMDSQSVTTTEVGGPERGYDAAKKVTGRKRQLVTDTLGILLLATVHAATVQDRDGARTVLTALQQRCPTLRRIWADGGYRGTLEAWVEEHGPWVLEIVRRPKGQKGFVVQARRWVVERTIAWVSRYRRLSKDDDYHPRSSERMHYLASSTLLLRRLTKAPESGTP